VTLESVEEAALASARADAQAVLSAARERTRALLAAAHAEAAALVEERRAAAERLADLERQVSLAAARSEARAIVLRAQQSILADAAAAAHTAARRLASGPRYGRLVERLTAEARERLAHAGPLEIFAAPGGGVVARAGSREIDYSLDAQVDRWLEALPDTLERLWQ
jgi:vacuolar-type H+-ATPase subunit E/Vma4